MAVQATSPSTSTSTSRSDNTLATIDPTHALDSRIDESDLDPAAFLKSVRELSEKREREDTERVRRLEEEIQKGRQDRARRREERARSISPEKIDLSQTRPLKERKNPRSIRSPLSMTQPASSPAAMDADRPEDVPVFKGFGSGSRPTAGTPSTQAADPSEPSQSASSLARSGTLSWQRRPSSRGANSRPQPTGFEAGKKEPRTSSREEPEKSRDQIAASLSSQHSAWFKQTADRSIGNAALRKNKEEVEPENLALGRRGLPGMSRDASVESTRQGSPAPSESVVSDTISRPSSTRDSTFSSTRFSATRTSTSSKPDLKSLIAADEGQEKASPLSDRTSSVTDAEQTGIGRTLTMSSSQARLATAQDRSVSPTKGMGGFVSSAMMKRADSHTKRWSTQPGGSLSRQNSLASGRSGFGGPQGSQSMPKLEPTPNSTEASNEPASRPTSSGSNFSNLTTNQRRDDGETFIKPTLPGHSTSKSVASNYGTTAEEGHISPPSSPSKRWSPTKSSWLESSITKPDSPKPVSARNSQPDWMANIAKVKAQRAGAETAPRPAEEPNSRSASPTKAMFAQDMLKRSESSGLGTPRTQTPKPAKLETPKSTSPVKTTLGRNVLPRLDSRDLQQDSSGFIPATRLKPPEPGDETAQVTSKPSKGEELASRPPNTSQAVGAEESTQAGEPAKKQSAPPKTPPSTTIKSKPEPAPKPQTDFRSTLRSRATVETKQDEQPEFLSRFGKLKKAETKNYVAPDLLKDNILRGKGDLTKTGGPVVTPRRDELKESLLAKREQWKKEKEEGVIHERKTSNPPSTPQKPEALARREMIGRTGSVKQVQSPEKLKAATPEALARQKSLRDKPKLNETMPLVTKQKSEPSSLSVEASRVLPLKQTSTPAPTPSSTASKQLSGTGKLASRFNPGLANILARGPPATTAASSNPPPRSESPALSRRTEAPSEPQADGIALQDMRKGRAKRPKKRNTGVQAIDSTPGAPGPAPEPELVAPPASQASAVDPRVEERAVSKPKPRAPPGSAASVMMTSLQKAPPAEVEKPATPLKGQTAISPEPWRPSTPGKNPSLSSKLSVEDKPAETRSPSNNTKTALFGARAMQPKSSTPAETPSLEPSTPAAERKTADSSQTAVPDFKGFGSMKRSSPTRSSPAIRLVEDNKENIAESSPSVKSAASMWGAQETPKRTDAPTQIQLPSKKDEEAAMRSAGLLASSPNRPTSRDGLGIALEQRKGVAQTPLSSAGPPPRPAKSSRSVSGQLAEASPNKNSLDQPKNATEQRLYDAFGSLPRSTDRLSIDTASLIASEPHQERIFKTIRKTVQLVSPEGVLRQLPPHHEYTFYDECVYVFAHVYSIANGPKKAEIFLWVGSSSSQAAADRAQDAAKKLAKTEGNAYIATVRHGFEPPGFLQALGGILITRRGSQEGATKQYMLCGRQHLGQITFDEVDFGVGSLCSGFAYLISFPVTLQETKLYLWKGSASSPEEISAARLAAMDLSETGEIIEVDQHAEFSSFLKVFGSETTKASIQSASEIWQSKGSAGPSKFSTRLFRIQKYEQKTGGGMFGSFFARRSSWNNNASPTSEGMKAEVKEISPFSQSDLEAECIYLLDAYQELHILIGPVFPSQPEIVRNSLLTQTLSFASEYAVLAASTEDRPGVPGISVVLSGVPPEMKWLFRFWDEGLGLWGTGGLMAGSSMGREGLCVLDAESVRAVVCGNR